ncbi:hypothetical protein KC338_g136 [Hortaea werneckii]|nr:hypothetical protein KC338_g136 [Hortaea werneckii]
MHASSLDVCLWIVGRDQQHRGISPSPASAVTRYSSTSGWSERSFYPSSTNGLPWLLRLLHFSRAAY